MKIKELFDFKTGKLPALEKTDEGSIPLVYGTTLNNGIVKFVSVDNIEQIFQPPLITVSYLGTAFVQIVPFTTSVVDKSNIIILNPKISMSLEAMYYYCYQINKRSAFGFHYGRRVKMARLEKMEVIPYRGNIPKITYGKILPNIQPTKVSYKMKKLVGIEEIFNVINAKSKGFDKYDSGDVPFISNGMINKGIVGYVTPNEDDRIFNKKSICVSAFCEATVQEVPFLPRGNGGSGLLVITPKQDLPDVLLDIYAAYINKICSWRFSYGRMVSKNRFSKIKVPLYEKK